MSDTTQEEETLHEPDPQTVTTNTQCQSGESFNRLYDTAVGGDGKQSEITLENGEDDDTDRLASVATDIAAMFSVSVMYNTERRGAATYASIECRARHLDTSWKLGSSWRQG